MSNNKISNWEELKKLENNSKLCTLHFLLFFTSKMHKLKVEIFKFCTFCFCTKKIVDVLFVGNPIYNNIERNAAQLKVLEYVPQVTIILKNKCYSNVNKIICFKFLCKKI